MLRVDGEILHTFSREKKVNKVCLEVGEVVTVSTVDGGGHSTALELVPL